MWCYLWADSFNCRLMHFLGPSPSQHGSSLGMNSIWLSWNLLCKLCKFSFLTNGCWLTIGLLGLIHKIWAFERGFHCYQLVLLQKVCRILESQSWRQSSELQCYLIRSESVLIISKTVHETHSTLDCFACLKAIMNRFLIRMIWQVVQFSLTNSWNCVPWSIDTSTVALALFAVENHKHYPSQIDSMKDGDQ